MLPLPAPSRHLTICGFAAWAAPPLDPGVWGGAPVEGRGGEGKDPPDTP